MREPEDRPCKAPIACERELCAPRAGYAHRSWIRHRALRMLPASPRCDNASKVERQIVALESTNTLTHHR